ncbi:hypothetical protein HELRODRAFT_190625 [Helobdella robusta]|uniref:Transmembrane protein 198 n=1 Tax=Helobdella robusta TaxID=6412 RepID=T1FS54_HELRO|nr:hypothetical protein HELRODRAFT_190625 [Helobdella robusta]ESO08821.1 hypothetical protein HELRODRAFT_190625 [Helobdella robusta]
MEVFRPNTTEFYRSDEFNLTNSNFFTNDFVPDLLFNETADEMLTFYGYDLGGGIFYNKSESGDNFLYSNSLDDISNDTGFIEEVFLNSTVTQLTNLTYNVTYGNPACPNISLNDFSVLPSIVYIVLVLLGSFLCVAGFRCIRPSLFIMATALTSTIVYLICCEVFVQNPLPPLVIAGSSVLSGILVGLAALFLISVGIRVSCCKAGLAFGIYILVSVRLFLNYPNPSYLKRSVASLYSNNDAKVVNIVNDENGVEVLANDDNSYNPLNSIDDDSTSPRSSTSLLEDDIHYIIPIIVTTIILLVCCVLITIFSFIKPKFSLIFSFSLAGSAMIILGIDFFTDKQLTLTNLFIDCLVVRLGGISDVTEHIELITCWTTWIVYGLLPAMVLMSLLFQYLCSARGINYSFKGVGVCGYKRKEAGIVSSSSPRRTELTSAGGKRTLDRVPVLSMDPSEKYRHLYRVRRTNGDVISRTQMEAIEVRKSNPMMMMVATSSNSDVTTTNDDADDVTLVLTRTGDE